MSTEADTYAAIFYLAKGESAWFPIFNSRFDVGRWANIFPYPVNSKGSGPWVKVTLTEVDWEIDENYRHVAWILLRNLDPDHPVECMTTIALMPND
jgi:hypothetical protein